MIVLKVPQGSPEWHYARLGIPTASQFDRIITPKTRKPASGSESYMHELLAEWATGLPAGAEGRGFMERGSLMEDWALSYYQLQTDAPAIERVGCVLRDDGMVACSPDALVGDGGLEIKCPSTVQHIANLLNGVDRYFAQAQGGMLITGRKWWDILSYHPEIPAHIVRVYRDEEYIAALSSALDQFVASLQQGRLKLEALGCAAAPSLDRDFAASLAPAGQ